MTQQKTILIADSGATKTDWALVSPQREVHTFRTQGISPIHQSEELIAAVLREELLPQLAETSSTTLSTVHFYGAGCAGRGAEKVAQVLAEAFPQAIVHVESDLLGAARAVCGTEEGIACILGTGSNSCLYDGQRIVENIPPLGYILGDEGSGAVLGRMFLNLIFKDSRLADLQKAFLSSVDMTYPDIIDRVYRQPLANRFLASIVPFVKENLHIKELREITIENFDNFLVNNVLRYDTSLRNVYAVGGMSAAFEPYLRDACKQRGLTLKRVLPSPIQGLIDYHSHPTQLHA